MILIFMILYIINVIYADDVLLSVNYYVLLCITKCKLHTHNKTSLFIIQIRYSFNAMILIFMINVIHVDVGYIFMFSDCHLLYV
jgi:hypothetical protein